MRAALQAAILFYVLGRVLASTLRAGDRETVRVTLEYEAAYFTHEKDLALVNLFHNYRVSSPWPYIEFGYCLCPDLP